jgi:hypothetical protein
MRCGCVSGAGGKIAFVEPSYFDEMTAEARGVVQRRAGDHEAADRQSRLPRETPLRSKELPAVKTHGIGRLTNLPVGQTTFAQILKEDP